MNKKNSPSSCGCPPQPVPVCPLSINLVDCSGSPISGASIESTNRFTGAIDYTGSTDASGDYTFPGNAFIPYTDSGHSFYLTYGSGIYSGGISGETQANCSTVLDLVYDHASFTVSTPTGAGATITVLSTGGAAFTQGSSTSSGGSTSTTFSYAVIRDATSPSQLPATVEILASPAEGSGYLSNCTSATIACDDSTAIDIPMFYFEPNYTQQLNGFGCDRGCDAVGEGPNYRGVSPRKLFVKWSATLSSNGADVSSLFFGSYAGVDIEVDFSDTSLAWSSGCLGPGSVPCNHLLNPYGLGPYFGSHTTGITRFGAVFWNNWVAGGCVPTAADGSLCLDHEYDVPPPPCGLVSPVMTTGGIPADSSTYQITVSIHE